jgi:sugar transferase (PEP-CTERM/EpsH1 system associated)
VQNRIKVFFIVSRFPYPLIKGDKLRAYHQIKGLSKDCDVYLCALTDEKIDESSKAALRPFCKDIYVHKLTWPRLIINIFKYFIFSKKPVQVGYFFNKNIARKIRQQIDEIKPDHLYCQLIRTAAYVEDIKNISKTLDYMDALSAGMARRAEFSTGLKKYIFNLEATRLKRFEHDIFLKFDQSLIISASDRDLIFHFENEEIKVVPNGIDQEYFTIRHDKKTTDLLFTGNMSYPPNIRTAVYLVKEIMPRVWQSRPQTSLLISGANPVKRVRELGSDRITVRGWIDDIRTSYAASRVFVAPMLIGSGLQNKLLEAMAMGMPCVASELANRSLGAESGLSILIGNEAGEYAAQILSLLENEKKASELAEKGHSFVTKNFNWTKSNNILLEILQHGKTSIAD